MTDPLASNLAYEHRTLLPQLLFQFLYLLFKLSHSYLSIDTELIKLFSFIFGNHPPIL